MIRIIALGGLLLEVVGNAGMVASEQVALGTLALATSLLAAATRAAHLLLPTD